MSDSWVLVDRARGGDMDAFADLYRRYRGFIRNYVYERVYRDPHLAEEITHDVFTRALAKLDNVSNVGMDYGAWLTTVARNLTADYRKSYRRRFDRTRDIDDAEVPACPAAEDGALASLASEVLAAAIKGLTPDQRNVLWLRFYEARSVAETARRTGSTVGAVKSLQFRALSQLRRTATRELEAVYRG
jgi:RNA polymerase sigma-70 factor, ECF subfamily